MGAGSTRGRGRPKNEALTTRRREDILVVATRVFAEKTFRGTDVQEIADRVGVGKGTVYRYFPSKDELFLAAVAHGLDGLRREMSRIREREEEPIQRFRDAVVTFLAYFDAHPELVEILIQERADFRRQGTVSFFSWTEEEIEDRRRFLDGLRRGSHLPDRVKDRLIETIAEFLFGTIVSARFSGRGISLVDRADDILDLLLEGLHGPTGHEDQSQ